MKLLFIAAACTMLALAYLSGVAAIICLGFQEDWLAYGLGVVSASSILSSTLITIQASRVW